MNSLFLAYLQNELGLSLLILLLLFVSPLLAKYYKANSRYYMWLLLLVALVIPYHFSPKQTLWQFDISPLIKHDVSRSTTEDALSSSNAQYSNLIDAPETNNSPEVISKLEQSGSQKASLLSITSKYLSHIFAYLKWIWLIGFIFSISYMLFSHIRFLHFSRKWYTPITEQKLLSLVDSLHYKLKLNQMPQVQYCKLLNTPITVGILRPIILLPCIDFDEQELTLLLSHEMIHCKRKDIWFKAFISLVQALHWYNPIIYLMKNRIYLDCETSCDELVLSSADEDTRLHYGEIIIDIIRHPNIKVSTLSSAFFIEKKKIKERLAHIMNTNLKRSGKILIIFMTALTIFSTVLFGFNKNSHALSIDSSVYASQKMPTITHTTDGSLEVKGTMDAYTSQTIATYSLKAGDTLICSLSHDITNEEDISLDEPLTLVLIDTQNTVSQLQISNANPTNTFTATLNDDYSLLLKNTANQSLMYSIKLTQSTPSSSISTLTPSPKINTSAPDKTTSPSKKDMLSQNDTTAKDIESHLPKASSIPSKNETTEKDLADYIAETNDIGALFININSLSQDTIDSIMISYIKRKNDIGMLFSAMDYLSQSAIDTIAKNYAESTSDLGMIEKLKPYVSAGVLK